MPKKKNTEFVVQVVAIVVLTVLLIYGVAKTGGSGIGFVSASDVSPSGMPAVYGQELGVSYDDVSPNNPQLADATINKLAKIDTSETLSGEQLDRYIHILYEMDNGISCEFCCGARSVIFSNGEPACGCAHSYAMRGLTKYLIKYHGDEFTDEQILEEVAKWKVLFFPGIHETKAGILKSQGIDVNYISLASNEYRGIEKGQGSGGMVGGC